MLRTAIRSSGAFCNVQKPMVRRTFASSNLIAPENDSALKGVESAAGGKVFYFTATWCPPCRRIAPIFEKLSETYASTAFVKIDVDQLPEAASKYGIASVPTFIFLNGTSKMSQFSGADENALTMGLENLKNV